MTAPIRSRCRARRCLGRSDASRCPGRSRPKRRSLSDKDRVLPRWADLAPPVRLMAILVTGGAGQLATALGASGDTPGHRPPRTSTSIGPKRSMPLFDTRRGPRLLDQRCRLDRGRRRRDASPTPPRAPTATARRAWPERCRRRSTSRSSTSPPITCSTAPRARPTSRPTRPTPTGVYGANQARGRAGDTGRRRPGRDRAPHRPGSTPRPARISCAQCSPSASSRDHLRVVADQRGCPTAATGPGRYRCAASPKRQSRRVGSDSYAGVFHSCRRRRGDVARIRRGDFRPKPPRAAWQAAPVVEPITTAGLSLRRPAAPPTAGSTAASSRARSASACRPGAKASAPSWARSSLSSGPSLGTGTGTGTGTGADVGPRPKAAV